MDDRNCSIKDYITGYFAQEDHALKHAHENSLASGFPDIHVPAHIGKLIYLLAKLKSPKKILEIGTLGGYSTLWLARALSPDGKIISIEIDPAHAQIAKSHTADFASLVDIRIGNAAKSLASLLHPGEAPFDVIFIDGEKAEYSAYLEQALGVALSGTVILIDNLIPKGEAVDNPNPRNKEASAVYTFNRELAAHPKLETILCTTIVGASGRIDALGIALVK